MKKEKLEKRTIKDNNEEKNRRKGVTLQLVYFACKKGSEVER